MDITIFPIIFTIFFCIILFILFTRRGKKMFVRAGFGKIIKDYGDLGSSRVRALMTQTLHLYECSNGKEDFFVLETRMLGNIQYTKISHKTAQNLIKAISSKS